VQPILINEIITLELKRAELKTERKFITQTLDYQTDSQAFFISIQDRQRQDQTLPHLFGIGFGFGNGAHAI
jgi:hypothetical protein